VNDTTTATWASSNTAVATVNNSTSKGLTTAVGGGTASISATVTGFTYTYDHTLQECFEHSKTLSASSTCDVRVPNHLQVISDTTAFIGACPSVVLRQIKMKVVDVNNQVVALVSIKENFVSISTNTCGNGQPQPSACANTDNANSEFTDIITINSCKTPGGSCGYNLTDEWQWCPSGLPAVDIGKLVDVVHANAITVNGVTTPNKIAAGTNIFP
jgi:hypothetical protein